MPVAMPNLYTTPQDVYEFVGADPAQLRLDDRNLASGQVVQTTVAAALAAVALTVTALQYPLLRGTVLVFDNAGMSSPVEVTLSAAAASGATSLAVNDLATAVPAYAQATDNGVNVWLGGLLSKACKYATAQVKSYCCSRYNDSDLVNSWSVNRWATAIAARWLAKRRYQAAPQGIEEEYQESLEELKAVKAAQLNIEDIGTRTSGWPFMSNVTIDLMRPVTKVRVEKQISEPTPMQGVQYVDWNSIFILEF